MVTAGRVLLLVGVPRSDARAALEGRDARPEVTTCELTCEFVESSVKGKFEIVSHNIMSSL
jgi:hypothetical protein